MGRGPETSLLPYVWKSKLFFQSENNFRIGFRNRDPKPVSRQTKAVNIKEKRRKCWWKNEKKNNKIIKKQKE